MTPENALTLLTQAGTTFLIAYGPILLANYAWNYYRIDLKIAAGILRFTQWMQAYTDNYNREHSQPTMTQKDKQP